MSKVTTSFASFAFGVLTSFVFLSGNHASILAQAPSQAPQAQNPPTLPGLVGGTGAPAVPPISQHLAGFRVAGNEGFAFDVDGKECTDCEFVNGPVLRYAGGNFSFVNFRFVGPVRFELTGAARNTALFMEFIQRLAASQAPPPTPAPKAPMVKTADIKTAVTGSFGTVQ